MNLVLERSCTSSSKKEREQSAPQYKNAVANSEANVIKINCQPSQVMHVKKPIYLNKFYIFVKMRIIHS